MTVIYIRHGDDHDKDPKYEQDHEITKSGKKDCKRVAEKLIEKYGHPDMIRVTPFLRGVQTVKAMKDVLKAKTEIVFDANLSRFFSKREKKNPSVAPETLEFKPPIMETRKEFHKRTSKHYKKMKKGKYFQKGKMIWCITHALVLKAVAEKADVSLPDHYDFLERFIVED